MFLKKIKKSLIPLFLIIFSLSLSGCGLRPPTPAQVSTLEIWGVWDDSDIMQDLIKQYKDKHKQITEIKYRKFTYDEYEKALLDALARGKGPDIFLAHHTWLAKHKDLMMDEETARQIYNNAVNAKSGCSKPPTIDEPLLTDKQFNDAFVKTVYNDFISKGKIYGIPLAVDTIALYYNEDMFSEAGLVLPPQTWDEFQKYSRKLTKIDNYNNITQVGVAMGTANNVNRAGDILAMLMMQYGCSMVDKNTLEAKLDTNTTMPGTDTIIKPALSALDYYTSFAHGTNPNYTWNPRLHNSIDIFQEGKAAMMLNYTYAINTIKTKAPKLNFKVTTIPQVKNASPNDKLTYANYWGYVVSKQSADEAKNKPIEAWKFLKFLGEKEQIQYYVNKTHRPASRKDIIQEQLQQPNIGTFAKQALIARSWLQPDEIKIQNLFNQNIEDVALNEKSSKEAISNLNNNLNVLLKEYKNSQ